MILRRGCFMFLGWGGVLSFMSCMILGRILVLLGFRVFSLIMVMVVFNWRCFLRIEWDNVCELNLGSLWFIVC